jgi:hypothetical protein
MKNYSLVILFISFELMAQSAFSSIEYIFPDEKPVFNLIGWKSKNGDSSVWSDPDYNDNHWEYNTGIGLWVSENKNGRGIRWYRKDIFFPEPLDSLSSLAFYQEAIVCANEIFWDGQIIAKNGQPGKNHNNEKTGLSGQIFPLPRVLTTSGKHTIAIRMSNFHTFSGLIESPIQIGYFSQVHKYLFRIQAMHIFLVGIFILTALFHFAILLGHGNKWPYALFSAFCVACAAHIFIRGLLRYFQIDLIHYYSLAALNDIPWFFMMILLPIFFMFEFNSPLKKRISVLLSSIALIVVVLPRLVTFGFIPITWLNIFIKANKIHVYFTVFVSITVAFWALFHRKIGSLSASVGLVIFLIGVYFSNRASIENAWAIGFTVLNIFLIVSLSNQMAHRNRLHQESDLRSTRLELELLKKHIQPHFLLNSLNSIVAWLEEDPPTASKLVNALAEELRMLLAFSGKKVISLIEEIELCRAHLQVMSLRQEKSYSLVVEGDIHNEKLPPLILHTLIENGLTHGYKGKDSGIFKLGFHRKNENVTISIFNDGNNTHNNTEIKDGTGLRYVKSRMEEAFSNMWTLSSNVVPGGWEVIIKYEEKLR